MFVFVFPLFYSAAVSAEAAATHLRLSIATRLRAPPTNTPPSPPSQLASTEEYVDGKMTGALGEVLVRCNNVLYIREAPDGGGGE